jgi:hypothetical protein
MLDLLLFQLQRLSNNDEHGKVEYKVLVVLTMNVCSGVTSCSLMNIYQSLGLSTVSIFRIGETIRFLRWR